jgi:hypothetical protein
MANQSKINKLGKIIAKEVSTLIPFSLVIPKISRAWAVSDENSKDIKNKGTFFRRMVTNGILSAVASIYVTGALSYGVNPLKPQEYFEKIKQSSRQKKLEEKALIKKIFTETDTNNDYVIDVNEFSNYLEKYHN